MKAIIAELPMLKRLILQSGVELMMKKLMLEEEKWW